MSAKKSARSWALVIVFMLALVSTSAPANASEVRDVTTAAAICSNPDWGGTLYCGGTYDTLGVSRSFYFDNGTEEVWGVAARQGHSTDHNVFTRWRYRNGDVSAWTNMGGKIYSKVDYVNFTGDDVYIFGTGGDGDIWCNHRRTNGTWSGWYPDQVGLCS